MTTPPFNRRLALCSAWAAFLTLCFSAVSLLASPPGTQAGIRWETDLNVATVRAEREQRPLFLHFVGNGGSSARQMENEVFTQPNIAAQLNANFVMVRINATENPALAQRFSVESIPTDLILRPNGQVIHRRVGAIAADVFADYLAFLQRTIHGDKNPPPTPAAPPATPPDSPPVAPPTASPAAPHAPVAASPFPAANPAGQPPQASPQVSPPAAAPPAVMPQPQHPMTAVVDPFAPQQPAMQPPVAQPAPAAAPPMHVMQQPVMATEATSPPPAYNPLRTGDTTRIPMEQAVDPAGLSGGPEGVVIPMSVPAPARMMVEVPLALEGFCPVTLSKEERWVSGNPAFCTMYQGHIFRFATREALVQFAQNPANYIPVAMGEDVVLMVDRNQRINGSRQLAAYCKGRIFLFASQETYDAFAQRPDYYMEIALRYETARKEPVVPVVY